MFSCAEKIMENLMTGNSRTVCVAVWKNMAHAAVAKFWKTARNDEKSSLDQIVIHFDIFTLRKQKYIIF